MSQSGAFMSSWPWLTLLSPSLELSTFETSLQGFSGGMRRSFQKQSVTFIASSLTQTRFDAGTWPLATSYTPFFWADVFQGVSTISSVIVNLQLILPHESISQCLQIEIPTLLVVLHEWKPLACATLSKAVPQVVPLFIFVRYFMIFPWCV